MNSPVVRSTACLLTALTVSSVATAQSLVFDRHTIRDPMVVSQDAVTFLKPRGWNVTGGVKWYHNLAHLACVEIKITNPNGLEQLETLPYVNCCWFTNPVIPMQRGHNYMGTIVHEPMENPRDVIERISLPELRGRLQPRIVDYRELPDVAKALTQLIPNARIRSGRLRIEYELDGQSVQEDIYLSLYSSSYDLGVNNCRAIMWGPAWMPFSIRAAKGKLDEVTPMLLAVANSARPEPRWFAEYQYVCSLFQKRMARGIQDAAELSAVIRRNSDEIFKMYSDSYWQRAASQERMSRQFSNYIRGVEQYSSPYERHPVQLPGGYKYAWAGSNGGYVLSNDAGFDPNVGGTANWQLLKVAE